MLGVAPPGGFHLDLHRLWLLLPLALPVLVEFVLGGLHDQLVHDAHDAKRVFEENSAFVKAQGFDAVRFAASEDVDGVHAVLMAPGNVLKALPLAVHLEELDVSSRETAKHEAIVEGDGSDGAVAPLVFPRVEDGLDFFGAAIDNVDADDDGKLRANEDVAFLLAVVSD